MKNILVVIYFLLLSIQGIAKCGSQNLSFWPNGKHINQNSIFVIEGYGLSQSIILELGKKNKVFLQSGDQKIKLNIQEIHVGQFHLTQAILKPEIILTSGHEYELIIENLDELEYLVKRYNDAREQVKIKWKVSADIDTISAIWKKIPIYKNSEYHELGCGPETNANFEFAAADNSEYLIKTILKNKSTGKETIYYLSVDDNKIISVGHDMCSGAFKYTDGEYFEVEFSLYDSSGNLTKWMGKRIEFKRPS